MLKGSTLIAILHGATARGDIRGGKKGKIDNKRTKGGREIRQADVKEESAFR